MRLIDADKLMERLEEEQRIYVGHAAYQGGLAGAGILIAEAPTVKPEGWISVEDRLPTYAELRDDHVLVLFDDGTICSTEFDECIEGESIFGEWRQNFDMETLGATDSYWMPFEGVTHWMPLPEPPEVES